MNIHHFDADIVYMSSSSKIFFLTKIRVGRRAYPPLPGAVQLCQRLPDLMILCSRAFVHTPSLSQSFDSFCSRPGICYESRENSKHW